MEASYKLYLEAMYSSIAGSKFLDLWEANDAALSGHEIILGPKGFLKREIFPDSMIDHRLSQERIINWMLEYLNTTGVREECYLFLRSGPWAHMEIIDLGEWIATIWHMKIPQTDAAATDLLLLTPDKTKTLFFHEGDHAIEVYLANLTPRTASG